MSVVFLDKKLSMTHWLSLVALFVGVVLVQLSTETPKKGASVDIGDVEKHQSPQLGFIAILIAVCCSGLSGVWFERILKRSSTSLWIRNIQLALVSLIFACFSSGAQDLKLIREHGFFQGFNSLVVFIILVQAGGGLLVALVVKYADNILKGFATSLATVLSTVASIFIFAFEPSILFVIGSTIVLGAAFLYGVADSTPQPSSSSASTLPTYDHQALDEKEKGSPRSEPTNNNGNAIPHSTVLRL